MVKKSGKTHASTGDASSNRSAKRASGSSRSTRVQVQNPITKRYVKLDTRTGRIIGMKKTPGPYAGIRIK